MDGVRKGPAVPGWMAAGIIGIALGVSGGYYGAHWNDKPFTGAGPAMAAGGPGGGAAGGGGMGGGQQHPQAMALVRSVGALATLEQARGKELSPDQRGKLAKFAEGLGGDKALTESDCESRLKELSGILNPAQQELLTDMTARPGGGRGGRGGPGGGARGGAGGPGGGAGPGGGGPGGGGADMDHPFKEGRGHDRLQLLVQSLKK